MIGVYQPGNSVLHRLPAGGKLAGLFVGLFVIVWLERPVEMAAAFGVLVLLFLATGLPLRSWLAQFKPILWITPFLFGLQWWLADWQAAVMVCGTMVASVGLAGLMILTTPVTAILDVCQRMLRPLRRFGVDPDRVGLVMALTIRCIPLMTEIVNQVSQARKARGITGLSTSIVALAAPAVIRALRAADALGEALIARGVDD